MKYAQFVERAKGILGDEVVQDYLDGHPEVAPAVFNGWLARLTSNPDLDPKTSIAISDLRMEWGKPRKRRRAPMSAQ